MYTCNLLKKVQSFLKPRPKQCGGKIDRLRARENEVKTRSNSTRFSFFKRHHRFSASPLKRVSNQAIVRLGKVGQARSKALAKTGEPLAVVEILDIP